MMSFERAIDEMANQLADRKYNLFMGGADDIRVDVRDVVDTLNTVFSEERLSLGRFEDLVNKKFYNL